MNDLGSNVEHMDRRYLWRASKHAQRVHIVNPETGRTFCQVENCGGKPFDGKGAEIPAGRRLCQNCADLARRGEADYREPSLAVLMGERLAETESELFASPVVPDLGLSDVQPERRSRARPAHRSRTHKPKRSEAKYPRPFDDALPW